MNEWLGFRAEGLDYFLWFMHALNVAGKGFFGHITGYFTYCEKNKIFGREGHQRGVGNFGFAVLVSIDPRQSSIDVSSFLPTTQAPALYNCQPRTYMIDLSTAALHSCISRPRLEVVLPAPADNDVVHLEHHPAQLGGEHELLLLADERVDDEGVLHVVAAPLHAVDAEPAAFAAGLDLLRLDLGQRGDGVQTAVLGEGHGHRVEGLGEGAHGVLLQAGRLDGRVLDGQRAGDLGGATTVDDTVVADEVADHTESIVEGALGFVDDLRAVTVSVVVLRIPAGS